MLMFAFATLYLACSTLLIAVVWQDRRRREAGARPNARDPRKTGPELVFRTHA